MQPFERPWPRKTDRRWVASIENRCPQQPHSVDPKTGEAQVPMFNSYHPLIKPRDEIWQEIKEDRTIRHPRPLEVFEIKDPKQYCEFHNSVGHSTRDCLALKEELERMARDRNMWKFFQKFVANRVDKDDRRKQPYNTNRGYGKKYSPENEREDDRKEEAPPEVHVIREQTPTILIISGGHASGGDTDRKRRRYVNHLPKAAVFQIEKKFPCFDNTIYFDNSDYGNIRFPHDDGIILSLKMEPTDKSR